MFPILFDSSWIGLDGALHFTISSYFFAIALGFVLAVALAYRDVKKLDIDRQKFIDFAIWMLIVGVLGGRLLHVLVDGFFWDYFYVCVDPFELEGRALSDGTLCTANAQCMAEQDAGKDIGAICNPGDGQCYPQRDCFRWLKFWAGGLTIYGSLIACVVVGSVYLRRMKWPVGKFMDMGGYAIPVGLSIGRLGCFLAGCCYGDVCHIDWLSVHFPAGSLAYQHHFEAYYPELESQWRSGIRASLPVYPTQLMESAYVFMIFLVAYFWVRPRKRFDGQILLVSATLYALLRFGIEFVRDDARGGLAFFSTSQWISLAVIVCTSILYYRLSKKPPSIPPQVGEEANRPKGGIS